MIPGHKKKSPFLLKTRFYFLKLSDAVVVNPMFGHNSWESFEHKLLYLALINFKRKKKKCRFWSSRHHCGKTKTQIEYATLNWNGVPKNCTLKFQAPEKGTRQKFSTACSADPVFSLSPDKFDLGQLWIRNEYSVLF